MSAFIPDQLDQMSRSDLLAFAQTAHEENVKLSKRVKELEDNHLKLVLWHNLDPQQAKLYSNNYANKFAIEQQIEGAFNFASFLDSNNLKASIAAKESGFFQLVESFAKQLRKEHKK